MTQLFYVEQISLAVTETCYVKICLIIVAKKFLFGIFKSETLYQRKFMSVPFPKNNWIYKYGYLQIINNCNLTIMIILIQRYDEVTNDMCIFIFVWMAINKSIIMFIIGKI